MRNTPDTLPHTTEPTRVGEVIDGPSKGVNLDNHHEVVDALSHLSEESLVALAAALIAVEDRESRRDMLRGALFIEGL